MKNKTLFLISLIFILIKASILYPYTLNLIKFNKGETFIYDIKVLGIPVAVQKSVIKDIIILSNKEVYYIQTSIKTTPTTSTFYNLDDYDETYIDTETHLPLLIKANISEGKWKNNMTMSIDYKNKLVNYSDKSHNMIVPFKNYYFGLVSIFYFCRSLSLASNETFEFQIHKKREPVKIIIQESKIQKNVYVKALKNQVNIKKFEVINEQKSDLWITDEEYKIPYRFTSIRVPIADYGYIVFINELQYYDPGITESP